MCSDLNCKIDKGLCHCGCGQPAPVAKKTTTRYGHIKGQPIRYINGHYQRSTRLSSVDYVVDAVTGCWIWQRSRLPSGYGQMRYAASGEINSTVDDAPGQVAAVRAAFPGADVDELDGMTVRLGDGSWFNLRASNTEPLLRLNVEAGKPDRMAALRDEVLAIVRR